jgi:ABC-type spermidine/putrescine transport system permease subunit II
MPAPAFAASTGRARGVAIAVSVWVLLTLGLPLVQLGQEAWTVVGPPAPPWIFVLAGLRALGLAAAVAVIAAVAAYPVARTVSPRLLLVLVLVSPLARALGVLGLGLAPGVPAVLLAQSAGAIPLAALVLQLRLRGRARVWLEAAADLGAGPWRRFWAVEVPLLAPAFALAAGWAALWALGDVTTLELAGGGKVYTLALLLRDAVLSEANPRRAAAIVAVMLAVAVPCALAIARGLAGLAGEVSGTGPRAGPGLRALGWLGAGLSALPLAGLIGQLSLQTGWGTEGSGGALLRGLLPRSLWLTLLCGALAAALGFTLALLRRRTAGRDAVAALVLLPLAVPPVVYGALMLSAGRLLGLAPGSALDAAGAAADAGGARVCGGGAGGGGGAAGGDRRGARSRGGGGAAAAAGVVAPAGACGAGPRARRVRARAGGGQRAGVHVGPGGQHLGGGDGDRGAWGRGRCRAALGVGAVAGAGGGGDDLGVGVASDRGVAARAQGQDPG